MAAIISPSSPSHMPFANAITDPSIGGICSCRWSSGFRCRRSAPGVAELELKMRGPSASPHEHPSVVTSFPNRNSYFGLYTFLFHIFTRPLSRNSRVLIETLPPRFIVSASKEASSGCNDRGQPFLEGRFLPGMPLVVRTRIWVVCFRSFSNTTAEEIHPCVPRPVCGSRSDYARFEAPPPPSTILPFERFFGLRGFWRRLPVMPLTEIAAVMISPFIFFSVTSRPDCAPW